MSLLRACVVVLLTATACNDKPQQPDALIPAADAPIFTADVVEAAVPVGETRQEWQVGPSPITVISASETDPNYDLYNISGVYRLSDGRLVMAPGNGPIKVYGSNGVHQMTAGRKGSGPGEYQQIITLGVLAGDTVAAFDNLLGRISLFTPEGRFARSLQIGSHVGARMGAFLPSGSFVGEQQPTSRAVIAGDQIYREQLSLFAYRLVDSSRVAFGTVAGMVMARTGSLPFSPSPRLAAGRHRVYVTPSDVFEIDAYDATGHQVHRLRADLKPASVGRAEVAAFAKPHGIGAADREALERHAKSVEGQEFRHHRVIQRLMADELDHVWVLPDIRATGADEKLWYIYDTSGRFVTTFPEKINGGSLLTVGADYIIAARLGEAGYTSIEVWPLVRTIGGSKQENEVVHQTGESDGV